MNPHLIKPKSNNEVEPDYVEYKLANSEIINKTRYFIQCLIQDRGNIPKQLLGSFDDLLNQCIDVSARSDAIPEPIIIQLEHFAKVFDDPPEHYFLFGQYANAFHQDFLRSLPLRTEPRIGTAIKTSTVTAMIENENEASQPLRTRPNPKFPQDIDELIHRLTKWKVFLETIIERSSESRLPIFGFAYLSSILPSLHVPNCYSAKGTALRMQSISHFVVDPRDHSYRWNSFRIKDEFGHFHYFSLVKERPMDVIYSYSAVLLAHFFGKLYQNDPNIAKRIDLSHRYNMLPLNAVTMLTERSRNEFSLAEIMRSTLKKKGVSLDDFLIAVAETKRITEPKVSPSELDAYLSMEGEVRDYL